MRRLDAPGTGLPPLPPPGGQAEARLSPARAAEAPAEPADLPALLDHWSAVQPGRTLFTFEGTAGAECWSWRGFAGRSARLALGLRAAGLDRGDRAILVHPPGIELVAALFACMRIGALATVAPVTAGGSLAAPRLHQRIAAIAADCRPALALGLAGQAVGWNAAAGGALRLLATDLVQGAAPPAFRDSPQPLALLQYTSGSTRAPRGVALTHANIIANARALIDHAPVGATWLPQFHDMGLIGHYMFPIVLGGSCHGMAAADFLRRPEGWLRLISERHATYAAAPPFAYEQLLQRTESLPATAEGLDLSSLRVLMAGAEPVPPDLLRRFEESFARQGLRPGVLVSAYGLAEATLAVTAGSARSRRFDAAALRAGRAVAAGNGPATELASAGPPLPNLRLSIVDPATGREAGPGAVGEIRVEGASVSPFYWHERGAAGSRRILATRDLGFLCEGELHVCGRSDEVILQCGENFHPQDVEAAVRPLLAARQGCAAFADAAGRATLLIEAVAEGSGPEAAALAARVAAATGLRLGRLVRAAPRSIARTTSGKLARAETRLRLEAGRLLVLADIPFPEAPPTGAFATLGWLRGSVACDPGLAGLPLAASGIDSLRLVQLQLEIEELATARGIGSGEALDGPMLQACDCGEVLALAEALERSEADLASARMRGVLARGREALDSDQDQMVADAAALPAALPARAHHPAVPERLLMTGATGFLGPHLLAALLARTALPITVIARGTDEAAARQRVAVALAGVEPGMAEAARSRVEVLCGDLALPDLGLAPEQLAALGAAPLAIYHNGAQVDYVQTYRALRPANVLGTLRLLELAQSWPVSHFHHVSSTFIFGWTRKPVLHESDANADRTGLDFGYSQSKWVAERLVAAAAGRGLPCTVYRPSLISVPGSLRGDCNDVAARLLAFMIRHRVAVDTPNQLSLVPADALARNLVGISLRGEATGASYHLTADRYYSLTNLTRQIGSDFGYRFRELSIAGFIAELNRLARPEDPVFPLLDFFNRSAPHIAAMTLKRYDNSRYRAARDRLADAVPDPDLGTLAARLVRFLEAQGWLKPDSVPAAPALLR